MARFARTLECAVVYLAVIIERIRMRKPQMMFQAAKWAAEDWLNERW